MFSSSLSSLKNTKRHIVKSRRAVRGFNMTRARIVQEEMKEKETVFLSTYVKTKNGSLILLSEGEELFGTLAVAIPQAQEMIGPSLSSILLGERNTLLARLLAERLAAKTRKIALVSVNIKTVEEREAGQILMKLTDKILAKEEPKK